MARFLAGFGFASLLWGVGGWAYFFGPLMPEPEVVAEAAPVVEEIVEEEAPTKRRRRRRGRRGSKRRGESQADVPQGNATTGDNLGENDARSIDVAGGGGEEQLTSHQIETVFDGAFGRIRRCFILAAGDEMVTGRVTFGLRIGGNGRVNRMNLSGPAAVTRGDSGDCLRQSARRLAFPTFDGPDMIVRYPITLE